MLDVTKYLLQISYNNLHWVYKYIDNMQIIDYDANG